MENKELETKLDIRTSEQFVDWLLEFKMVPYHYSEPNPKTLLLGTTIVAVFSLKNEDLSKPLDIKVHTFADGVEFWVSSEELEEKQELLKEWKELNNGNN